MSRGAEIIWRGLEKLADKADSYARMSRDGEWDDVVKQIEAAQDKIHALLAPSEKKRLGIE